MFSSRFMPCLVCGASVDQTAAEAHTCDPQQRASYVMYVLRDEIDAFEGRLQDYLASSEGRFESWLAARDVRRTR